MRAAHPHPTLSPRSNNSRASVLASACDTYAWARGGPPVSGHVQRKLSPRHTATKQVRHVGFHFQAPGYILRKLANRSVVLSEATRIQRLAIRSRLRLTSVRDDPRTPA